MRVEALVGKSGTGKSFKAIELAIKRGVDLIVDDGLLISDRVRLTGTSAKSEQTKVAAVKRALFLDPDHRREARELLERGEFGHMLIIGTSVKMVNRIAEALDVAPIDELIMIEEISTDAEIKKAREERLFHGKHIIPLPTLEIKRDFSGHFFDTLHAFIKRRIGGEVIEEKTVVRPTFSQMGQFTISDHTLYQILDEAVRRAAPQMHLEKRRIYRRQGGLEILLEMGHDYPLEEPLSKSLKILQMEVFQALEHMTHLYIRDLTIVSKNLYVKKR